MMKITIEQESGDGEARYSIFTDEEGQTDWKKITPDTTWLVLQALAGGTQ